MHEVDELGHSAAPPETVFELLADGSTWADWGAFDTAAVKGDIGLGQERFLNTGRVKNHEKVVEFDPPRTLGYVSLSGLPVRNYKAEVTLTPADGGTDIRWHSQFEGRFGIGWLVERRLRAFIAETVELLARGAERDS